MYSTFSDFPAPSLPVVGDAPPWPGGVLAAGSILVSSPGVAYSCRIGRDDGGGNPCGCGPPEDNPCVIEAPCWGDLCDVSSDALFPNTTYRVRIPLVTHDGPDAAKLNLPIASRIWFYEIIYLPYRFTSRLSLLMGATAVQLPLSLLQSPQQKPIVRPSSQVSAR